MQTVIRSVMWRIEYNLTVQTTENVSLAPSANDLQFWGIEYNRTVKQRSKCVSRAIGARPTKYT
jgi:hypothetical protein